MKVFSFFNLKIERGRELLLGDRDNLTSRQRAILASDTTRTKTVKIDKEGNPTQGLIRVHKIIRDRHSKVRSRDRIWDLEAKSFHRLTIITRPRSQDREREDQDEAIRRVVRRVTRIF